MNPGRVAEYGGHLFMTRVGNPDNPSGILLDRADPKIRVAHELMHELMRHGSRWATFDGHLLKIVADNGTAIYRVDDEDFPRRVYLMSWPD